MDFWDVARLMWRRWYVTAPALLLTILAALVTGLSINPEYQVTGHVAVVGPSVQRESTSTITHVNPWSPEALADASVIRLQGKALADTMEAEGYSSEWGATVTGRLPVIRLEVIASTPEEAQATLQRLLEVIDEEVELRQLEHQVAPEERISTVPYDGGEIVEPVTGKLKRAVIVVIGAGLIFTVGVVVAVDAWLRRKAARRQETAPPSLDWPIAGAKHTPTPPPAVAASASAPVPTAGTPNGGAAAGARASVRVQYTNEPTSPPVPSLPQSEPYAYDDSTIVLPLSNSGFRRTERDLHGSAPEGRP